jgi:phospholipid/cholesterol/gamma-HCH transport system ATP-binding protein
MIRLEDVYLAKAHKEILSGITLEVSAHERLVILGESGVGKSTILKLILGLWKPDQGRVLLAGDDIHRLPEEEFITRRKALAVVFQGGALFDSLTVGENVGYRLFEAGRLEPAAIERIVREKLVEVGLEEAIDLYPSQLSGGMRKRAAIARALAADPQLILFDEPTAGLDPVASCRINELIVRCQEEGKGTVVVTHNLECAFRVGEQLMLLDNGRIVFHGDRSAMESSTLPAVRRFLHPAQYVNDRGRQS